MSPHSGHSAASKRILAVDDEKGTLAVVRRILQNAGVETDTASSREEALQRLRERAYDLVLLDMRMLGVTLEEAIGVIRRQAPRIVVLLMTGGAEQVEVDKARALGAVGPVLKPFEPKTLVEAVRNHL